MNPACTTELTTLGSEIIIQIVQPRPMESDAESPNELFRCSFTQNPTNRARPKSAYPPAQGGTEATIRSPKASNRPKISIARYYPSRRLSFDLHLLYLNEHVGTPTPY